MQHQDSHCVVTPTFRCSGGATLMTTAPPALGCQDDASRVAQDELLARPPARPYEVAEADEADEVAESIASTKLSCTVHLAPATNSKI